MKQKIYTLFRHVLLLLITSIVNAQNPNSMNNQPFTPEQNQVLQAINQMTNAFHNKDIEGVMAIYEPNTLVVFEPEHPISESNHIRSKFLEAFLINPKFTYSGHEVFINGDLATHFAPWTMTGVAPDGTPITQSGLSVAILRKQENGKWLIIFDNPHGSFLMQKKSNE